MGFITKLKRGESVLIGDAVEVHVRKHGEGTVELEIVAPPGVIIDLAQREPAGA
jgi:sRNA-binding carbon storage regulator CsrA